MATVAQIAANQLNAQKSTGPKTEAGKEASSMNAVTHGIFVTNPIAEGENLEEFNQLCDAVISVYNPADPIEEMLVERIIFALWRQKRARSAETAMINLGMSDRAVAAQTNLAMKLSFPKILSEDDIFGDLSAQYQWLLKLKKELEGLDFMRVSGYPSTIENKAPLVYEQLPDMAKKYKLDWDKFIAFPTTIQRALEDISDTVDKGIARMQTRVAANKTAQLLKQTQVVPNEESARLITTYEAKADNAYAKAVDALRKHRLDKQKVIEAEIVPS